MEMSSGSLPVFGRSLGSGNCGSVCAFDTKLWQQPCLYVFGGFDGKKPLNNLLQYSLAGQWCVCVVFAKYSEKCNALKLNNYIFFCHFNAV
jgi:hypothetical protein